MKTLRLGGHRPGRRLLVARPAIAAAPGSGGRPWQRPVLPPIFLLLLLGGPLSAAPAPPTWHSSVAAAQEQAAQAKKLLFLELASARVPACARRDQEVYREARLARVLTAFVCVRLDAERDRAAVAQWQPTGFPTLIVLQADGTGSPALSPRWRPTPWPSAWNRSVTTSAPWASCGRSWPRRQPTHFAPGAVPYLPASGQRCRRPAAHRRAGRRRRRAGAPGAAVAVAGASDGARSRRPGAEGQGVFERVIREFPNRARRSRPISCHGPPDGWRPRGGSALAGTGGGKRPTPTCASVRTRAAGARKPIARAGV